LRSDTGWTALTSASASTTTPHRLTGLGLVSLLACALLACSGGGGRSDAADDADAGGSSRDEAAADGEPSATDASTVQPFVERLLASYDGVVNQIVADPDIAGDPDHTLVHEYLDLYEPDSDSARQLIDVWADRAADGLSTQPIEPDQPASRTRLDGDIEVRSDHEVAFPACIELRLEVVDGEGRVTQRTPYREQEGDGVAVWVDGEWRLRDLVVHNGTASCRTETDTESDSDEDDGN
jgi:hypothetical protein